MTRDDTLRALEQEVGVMIRRVRRVIGIRAQMVHPDLQPAAYLLLSSIADSGPVRASELVERFDTDKGAISRQVSHLLELELLAKEKDPADARASLVSVTDEARSRMADVVEHRHKLFAEGLSEWSEAELEGFVKDLGRYNTALNEASGL
ncbi:MarR family winged helix-turn-helix transcriptional regulator [Nocardioides sp.]|uniref:MarR family winged helix-turn-helix transcriptional regulator n=1 Tax=Nocardioides sp. TaxID=35761 RepID=UPI002B265655|nr:MarR family winged helix-turn-helix transcriptional regulator [Nocardioides sp.]